MCPLNYGFLFTVLILSFSNTAVQKKELKWDLNDKGDLYVKAVF